KLIFTLLLAGSLFSGYAADKKSLFDFPEKWVYVLKNNAVPQDSVLLLHNGILTVGTKTNGYIRTAKKYTKFKLTVEWRWPKIAGNSGVLIHIQDNDSVWPLCYQVQQKAGAAGDILCMSGVWAKECTDSVKFTVDKFKASNEKPVGEWNTMTVISDGKSLTVYINGELQNHITGLTHRKGYIGFQAEGRALEFRNLTIF
ncbi:MAG: DUF1080 domain-containing protein, partial [Paludibacter sp.]|nr:DUF1080 domain-containing protein [Paludibacter sp.]